MHGKRMGTLLGLMGAVWLAACGGSEALEEAPPSTQEQALAPVTLPIRINSGGGAFTDTYGRLWQADTAYSGGQAFQTTAPIAGTENDGLYQSLRIGDGVSYSIPVPGPGIYTVQFLLIEPEPSPQAVRRMQVLAEYETHVYDYRDLVTPLRAYTLSFDVPVRDGHLNLWLRAIPGSPPPGVSAVEVTDSRWKWLGGSPQLSGQFNSRAPQLAVDGTNQPVVAWEDDSLNNILVSRWTGSTWQQLGDAPGGNSSSRPVLLMDAAGSPMVAFVELRPFPAVTSVRMRRWSGVAWSEVGDALGLEDYEAQSVAATLDNQGRPLVAVVFAGYNVTDSRLHVYRFNGLAWEQVGDALASLGPTAWDGSLRNPSIAVDRFDRIVVAWDESYWRGDLKGKMFTHVFRRSGSQWLRVGTKVPDDSATLSQVPSLALAPDGTPWVAYVSNGIVGVVREQNGAWAATPTAGLKGWGAATLHDVPPLLRMDGAGVPTVLLISRAPDARAGRFLRKWNGSAWVPVMSRVGPFDTSPFIESIRHGLRSDMGFAFNKSGHFLVAMPEDTPSGASHGPLRVRTFTP
ncbi:malectin domain-containing carbohydrate-binding protein [Pyxidicoccus trucidator]|uniref:malectin domain-containing carbohydrate-binding protein n=1 Tax=Pyxidicoccus trucidator TaxID=2709662 RepID=UPI0013DCE2BA|nr:malectin domain-containing carbohydrate-binding protein [Pyxidicoccus trucidator]